MIFPPHHCFPFSISVNEKRFHGNTGFSCACVLVLPCVHSLSRVSLSFKLSISCPPAIFVLLFSCCSCRLSRSVCEFRYLINHFDFPFSRKKNPNTTNKQRMIEMYTYFTKSNQIKLIFEFLRNYNCWSQSSQLSHISFLFCWGGFDFQFFWVTWINLTYSQQPKSHDY